MSKDIAIEANALTKTYPPDVRALDRLSLAVPAGTIFGLLGPNGAGKSTTVRILTTLSRPDGGSARVAGLDVLAEPVRVRHAIGVVAQRHGLDPEATGRENLTLQGDSTRSPAPTCAGASAMRSSASAWSTPPTGPRRRTPAACSAGSTWPWASSTARACSSSTSRPPVSTPRRAPTSGTRSSAWRATLTTHYLEEADRLASQLAIVDRGRIVAEGSPDALKSQLEGDRIQVELVDAHDGAARQALAGVDGVGESALEGRTLHARARDGAAAIPAVLAALDAHGVKAASVTLARPSLDDVYLRHAGRSFDRADAEHEAVAA